MTETVGQVHQQDHHRIDDRFADFARSLAAVPDTAAFAEAAPAVHHYIFVDEQHHLPSLRDRADRVIEALPTGTMPTGWNCEMAGRGRS